MRYRILLALLLISTSPLFAQYVVLYEGCNFKGSKSSLTQGSYRVKEMGIDNDRLSSIQIPSDYKVTLYEHDNFQGNQITYTSSVGCLGDGWNDVASSIKVEYTGSGNNNNSGNGNGNNWNNSGKDFVTLYVDCNNQGASQKFKPGTYYGYQLGQFKYNLSSFTINGNLRVRLFANNENASGNSTSFENSETCLPRYLNDKTASLIIEYKNDYNNNNGNNSGYNGNNYGNNQYATVYTDCNYRGSSLRLAPGSYSGDKLGLLKYDISSIQLPSGFQAKVYLNNEYTSGYSYTLTGNTSCLGSNLNNRIASLVIEDTYGNNGNGNGYNGNGNGYDNNNNYDYSDRVIIYEDENFGGRSSALRAGSYPNMQTAGFMDNALSSLKLPAGYKVVLYEDENFKGKSYTVNQTKPYFLLSGWGDRASSIVVMKE